MTKKTIEKIRQVKERMSKAEKYSLSYWKLKDDLFSLEHPIRYRIREIYYPVRRFIIKIIDFFRIYIRHYYQRARYGISDIDVWGFDDYLSEVIIRGLENLKKHSTSYPAEKGMTRKKWHSILQKIIVGFKIQKNVFWREDFSKEQKEEVEMGWKYFKKYFSNFWD